MKSSRGMTVLAAVILGLSGLGAGVVRADIIVDNLPADTYTPAGGWTVSGSASPAGGPYGHSESFVAGITATLTEVRLPMWNAGGTNGFTLTLTDASSNVLETWTAAAPGVSNSMPVVVLASVLQPLLTMGATYTLTAVADSTTWDAWEYQTDSYTNGTGGYRLTGIAAVPEPSTLALVGLGGLALAGCGLRRRRDA